MPESVTDRCTKSHEYIFLLAKSRDYYYDHEAIKEKAVSIDDRRMNKERIEYGGKRANANSKNIVPSFAKVVEWRNKRSVWNVSVKPISESHFATYPPDLILPCILAGSREGGTVLDCFCGSGTTGIVALNRDRNFIGIELNPEYAELSKKRIENNVDYTLFDSLEAL